MKIKRQDLVDMFRVLGFANSRKWKRGDMDKQMRKLEELSDIDELKEKLKGAKNIDDSDLLIKVFLGVCDCDDVTAIEIGKGETDLGFVPEEDFDTGEEDRQADDGEFDPDPETEDSPEDTKDDSPDEDFDDVDPDPDDEPEDVEDDPVHDEDEEDVEDEPDIVYEEVSAEIRTFTIDGAKELIGWGEEPDKAKWGKDYDLKDGEGTKVRLTKNTTNVPFRIVRAKRYKDVFLSDDGWELNGESIILDWFGTIGDGQHRLVGFILAGEENPELTFETAISTGVNPDVIDTVNLGTKRDLKGVLARRRNLGENLTRTVNRQVAAIYAAATKLVWSRIQGETVSKQYFPHSVAFQTQGDHPRLLEACRFIYEENGGQGKAGKRISSKVSLGNAAAMMYLAGTSDDDVWEKAEEFWVKFSSGADLGKESPILALRDGLIKISTGGGMGRDLACGMIAKAWLAYKVGAEGTDVRVKMTTDKITKRKKMAEYPRVGGFDLAME